MPQETEEPIEAWESEYRRRHPSYVDFVSRLERLIKDVLRKAEIDVAQVEGRAKTVESFTEKINRKSGAYTKPLDEVTDLAGIRIITYYVEDADAVAGLLREEFQIDQDNSLNKSGELGPREFGYGGVHYVVTLASSRKALAEWADFGNMCAEIQVRTVTQHAWAAVEHKLNYKSEHAVPDGLQRRFYRLSAIFELADEQFSSLRRDHVELAGRYSESVRGGELDIKVDAASLDAYLDDNRDTWTLMDDARNAGWAVQDPRDDPEQAAVERADLLRALLITNVQTLREFDALLNEGDKNLPVLRGLCERGWSRPTMPDEVAALLVLVRRGASIEDVSQIYKQDAAQWIVGR